MVQRLTQTAKAVQIISNRVLLNYALQKLEILFVSPQYNCSDKYQQEDDEAQSQPYARSARELSAAVVTFLRRDKSRRLERLSLRVFELLVYRRVVYLEMLLDVENDDHGGRTAELMASMALVSAVRAAQ